MTHGTKRSSRPWIRVMVWVLAVGADLFSAMAAGEEANDPNLPRPQGDPTLGLAVAWMWNGDTPIITILDQRFAPGGNGGSTYLGWDEQGSYIVNFKGQVLCFTLRLDSLLECYSSERDIPLSVLKGLHNAQVAWLLPKTSTPAPAPARTTPPPVVGPVSADDVRAAVGRVSARTSSSATTATPPPVGGSQAHVRAGVLTFVAQDGTTQSFYVERTPIPGTPVNASAADTGSWVDWTDNKIFDVRGDGSVSMSTLDPRVRSQLLLLKQLSGTAH